MTLNRLLFLFICLCMDTQAAAQTPPQINGEQALKRLTELVNRGHRYYGAPKRNQQIQYMKQQLQKSGFSIIQQDFTAFEPVEAKQYKLSNIIGRLHPERPHRILLGSHWDTRLWAEEDPDPKQHNSPIPGANDGSSGVALLLELASVIRQHPPSTLGIDVVFFDGEEFGRPGKGNYCKGSEYFASNLQALYPQRQLDAAVIIDMIADKDLTLEQEKSTIRFAPVLWRSLTTHLSKQNIAISPNPRSIRDDQSPLLQKGIPAALLIDLQYPYWHTHQDTLDKCSPLSLEKVGNALLGWLYQVDGIYRDSLNKPTSP